MKTSKYSDSLIMSILKQAEAGTPIPNLCREHGMSSAKSKRGAKADSERSRKPWEALGISRAWYYRQKKKGLV